MILLLYRAMVPIMRQNEGKVFSDIQWSSFLAGQPRKLLINRLITHSSFDGQHAFANLIRAKASFDVACGVTGWTLHDLRRTARSLISRAGVNADVAERRLGHVISGVRGTYDRHAHFDEKKRAFKAMASPVERIVNSPTENMIAYQRNARSRAAV
jgi:integrase